MRIRTGEDGQGNGQRCASGRETTAVVCKKHRSGFVKPPRWFSQTTALLSSFAYEPSPSSLSPLPVSLGLSARFVDAVPPRPCAPRLPRLSLASRQKGVVPSASSAEHRSVDVPWDSTGDQSSYQHFSAMGSDPMAEADCGRAVQAGEVLQGRNPDAGSSTSDMVARDGAARQVASAEALRRGRVAGAWQGRITHRRQ